MNSVVDFNDYNLTFNGNQYDDFVIMTNIEKYLEYRKSHIKIDVISLLFKTPYFATALLYKDTRKIGNLYEMYEMERQEGDLRLPSLTRNEFKEQLKLNGFRLGVDDVVGIPFKIEKGDVIYDKRRN